MKYAKILTKPEKYHWLYQYIKTFCTKRGDFTLSSGLYSDKYFDLRLLLLDGDYLSQLFFAISNELEENGIYPIDYTRVGGLEVGAIPLISLMCNRSGKKGFWVRKQVKDHGTGKRIEGFEAGPYLLVDDVVTSGFSMNKVIEVCGKPVAKFCIIDRSTEKHSEYTNGLISIFKESDFD
jgi:orotate phosphoribosyltransferase